MRSRWTRVSDVTTATIAGWVESDLPVGTVRPAVLAPAHVLSVPCDQVDPTGSEVVQLAADLIATMQAQPACVGLAANQVGESAAMFALDVSEHPKTKTSHGRFVLVNPVIEVATRKERAREGCLSVPDFTGDVRRATRLTVCGYLPGTGLKVQLVTDAFEARAIQHEIDHLNGLLFLDRVAGPHSLHVRQTYG